MPDAVIFDLDGVLVDSEQLWNRANREIIDLVLDLAGRDSAFTATVSSEEVARGKPDPDDRSVGVGRDDQDVAACTVGHLVRHVAEREPLRAVHPLAADDDH